MHGVPFKDVITISIQTFFIKDVTEMNMHIMEIYLVATYTQSEENVKHIMKY